ncbi:hypothetical protein [Streptomyces sp. RTd22]|uniref:hypothetical protein n=1 Tax=Streptomyces sp. RTd22 TaxID=1841249 RepID=UPI0007C53F47|nr:hypothetical protein [Streptomyces sp. RTd22]
MPQRRDTILSELEEHLWVASVSMGWLREHYEPEWGRLSTARAAEISNWLLKHEIRHLPSPLPSRETEKVMLYKPTSLIGVYIAAARLEGPFERHPESAAYFLGSLAERLDSEGAGSEREHD